jgi:hypothetical protein
MNDRFYNIKHINGDGMVKSRLGLDDRWEIDCYTTTLTSGYIIRINTLRGRDELYALLGGSEVDLWVVSLFIAVAANCSSLDRE